MAGIYIDGFDDYAVADYAKFGWLQGLTSGGTVTNVTGLRGVGSAVRFTITSTGGSGAYWRRSFPSTSTLFIHARLRIDVASAATLGHALFFLFDGATTHLAAMWAPSGALEFRRAAYNGIVLGTVSAAAFPAAGVPFVFESKIVINDTTGSIVVKINGTQVLSLTAIDTRNAAAAQVNDIFFGDTLGWSTLNAFTWSLDDLILYDASGGSFNDFIGERRVDSYLANADGDLTQWTPSTGSDHFALVDEATPNTTDYVESATAGQIDRFAAQNMAHTPTDIIGVQVVAVARKDDAGALALKVGAKSGATVSTSAAQALTAGTDLGYSHMLDIDPGSSAAWTKAGIDALQIQIETA